MNQDSDASTSSDSKRSSSALGTQPDRSGKKWSFKANPKYFTICVYVIATFCICLFLYKFTNNWSETTAQISSIIDLLTPFFLAFIIAYFMNPLIRTIYKLLNRLFKGRFPKVHKVFALIISYVIFIGLIVLLLTFVVPQIVKSIMDLIAQIPVYYENLNNFLDTMIEAYPNLNLESVKEFINENLPNLFGYAEDLISNLLPMIYSAVGSIVSWIVNIILAFVISCYIMGDKNNLKRGAKRILYAFFPESTAKTIITIIKKSNTIFSAYIIGKAIDSLIIGILCFILMNILGLPYTVLVSVIIGVTNMIPYFGPCIGAIPGAILMLLSGPIDCVIFLIMILALQQFDGNILGPKILGDSTGLKPIWIIFAITVGGYMAGVIGMFLGVPIVAVLSYLLNTFVEYLLRKRDLSPATAAALEQPENGPQSGKPSIISRITNPHPTDDDDLIDGFFHSVNESAGIDHTDADADAASAQTPYTANASKDTAATDGVPADAASSDISTVDKTPADAASSDISTADKTPADAASSEIKSAEKK